MNNYILLYSHEKYTSHFIWKGSKGLLKGFIVKGSWRPTRTATYWPPLLWTLPRFFPLLLGCSTGGLGPHSAGCRFSLTHLISNWLNFLCTELYNSSTSTFLWASQIALIQPVHGQGYILIFLDRMHLLFTLVHFLFWQSGRVGGQYTTISLSCNNFIIWRRNRDDKRWTRC